MPTERQQLIALKTLERDGAVDDVKPTAARKRKAAAPKREVSEAPAKKPKTEKETKPKIEKETKPKIEKEAKPAAGKKKKGGASTIEPYPNFARPLPAECQAARDIMAEMHGARPQGKPHCKFVLDSVVRTILSQNTTDTTSARAFASLKELNPTWQQYLDCGDAECEESIRVGGLAESKNSRIKAILRTLQDERGELSMEYLRAMPTDQVKDELLRFKGVGPKTVACVLMFTLQRAEFPVDTHVGVEIRAATPRDCLRGLFPL